MSDVLSQAEIDALLQGITSGEIDTRQVRAESQVDRVRKFDFLHPNKFSKDQLRTLQLLHENFARLAGTQLSGQLRTRVELEITSTDQVSYEEYVRSMPTPTLVNVLEYDSLAGNGIMELNLPLTFAMVDRLVGGPGQLRQKIRELTEIEVSLMRSIVESLLAYLSDAWSAVVPVTFRYVSSEMNPQFAQIVAPSDMVMLVVIDVEVGDSSGMITLCLPYHSLEPILERFTPQTYFGTGSEGQLEVRESIEHELEKVAMPVAAVLGDAPLTLRELMALEDGDVIPLSTIVGRDLTVTVAGRPAFRAQPGLQGKVMAVQVTEVIDQDA